MKPAPGSSGSAKLPKRRKAGQWPLGNNQPPRSQFVCEQKPMRLGYSEPAGSSRSESENRFTVVGPVT